MRIANLKLNMYISRDYILDRRIEVAKIGDMENYNFIIWKKAVIDTWEWLINWKQSVGTWIITFIVGTLVYWWCDRKEAVLDNILLNALILPISAAMVLGVMFLWNLIVTSKICYERINKLELSVKELNGKSCSLIEDRLNRVRENIKCLIKDAPKDIRLGQDQSKLFAWSQAVVGMLNKTVKPRILKIYLPAEITASGNNLLESIASLSGRPKTTSTFRLNTV